METKTFTCLALSPAGCIPEFGSHHLNKYNGKMECGYGYFCQKSETAVSIAGGGKEFAALHWNRKNMGAKIDAPDGWGWAELTFTYLFIGGKTELSKSFVGFKIDHKEDSSFDVHFLDLETLKISTVSVPKFKTHSPVQIDISEVWCTSGEKWPIVHILITNHKWFSTFHKALSFEA